MEFRLKILFDAGVINKDVYQGMLQVVNKLEQHWQLKIRHPQGEMTVTHMANALMRASRGELIAGMDEDLLAEVKESAVFDQLVMINNDLLNEFTFNVPENELGYLLANLYGLSLAQEHLAPQDD